MNKRLKKKSDKIRRNAIHALLDTVLDINGFAPRQRERSGELPTVFVYISGHVGNISIDVHSRGWYPDEYADFQANMRMEDSRKIHEINDALKTWYL